MKKITKAEQNFLRSWRKLFEGQQEPWKEERLDAAFERLKARLVKEERRLAFQICKTTLKFYTQKLAQVVLEPNPLLNRLFGGKFRKLNPGFICKGIDPIGGKK